MANLYTSIEDLPIWNWRKIHETNNLKYLMIKGKVSDKRLTDAFNKIMDEFIDTFGISETHKEILLCQRDIAVLEADMAISGDRFVQNFIDMRMIDLKKLQTVSEKSSYNETKVHIEKFLGFRINEKETPVKDYYSYVEVFKKQNKA